MWHLRSQRRQVPMPHVLVVFGVQKLLSLLFFFYCFYFQRRTPGEDFDDPVAARNADMRDPEDIQVRQAEAARLHTKTARLAHLQPDSSNFIFLAITFSLFFLMFS
jgi:hypothetical protein